MKIKWLINRVSGVEGGDGPGVEQGGAFSLAGPDQQ